MNARDEYTARISELLYLSKDFESEARWLAAHGHDERAMEVALRAAECWRDAWALMLEMQPGHAAVGE
jgi:hypothetical protein